MEREKSFDLDTPHPRSSLRPSSPDKTYDIVIEPHRVFKVLLLTICALSATGIFWAYVVFGLGYNRLQNLAGLFLLDNGQNIPTLFSFALLIMCSLFLAAISIQECLLRAEWRYHWVFLSAVIFLMSFDEAASVHERFVPLIWNGLDASGWLFDAWVISGGAFVVLVTLAYLRFVMALPQPFSMLFAVSAVLYTVGALGFDMIGGAYAAENGMETFAYHFIATVEETLEMIGLAVFSFALLLFLTCQKAAVRFRIRAG